MPPAGRFQIFSANWRCFSLVTTPPPGSAWQSVPTSRTVPQAEGWPVRLVGASPGLPKWPESRWIPWISVFIAVPRVCWLAPMHQRLVMRFFLSPKRPASMRMSAAGTPESFSTCSGVYSASKAVYSSSVLACPLSSFSSGLRKAQYLLTKSLSQVPFFRSRWAMPLAMARSV